MRKVIEKGLNKYLASKVASIGLGFVSISITARYLGPSDFGFYTAILTQIAIMVVLGVFGLHNFVVKSVAAFLQEKDQVSLVFVLKKTNKIAFVSSFIVSVLYLFFAYKSNYSMLAAVLVVGVFFLGVFNSLAEARLKGCGEAVVGSLPEYIFKPLFYIGLIVLMYFFSPSPENALMANFLATMIASIGIYIVWIRVYQRNFENMSKLSDGTQHGKGQFKEIYALFAVSLLNGYASQADILMASILGSSEDVGLLRIAISYAAFVMITRGVTDGLIAEKISKAWSEKNYKELDSMVDKSRKWMFKVSLAISVALLIGAGEVIRISLGESYEKSYLIMQILIFGNIVAVTAGPVIPLYTMTGYSRVLVSTLLISLAVSAFFCFALYQSFGVLGLAVVSALTVAINSWFLKIVWVFLIRPKNDCA